jgi:protocatechuate 3,4-dioxygenase beta subunit
MALTRRGLLLLAGGGAFALMLRPWPARAAEATPALPPAVPQPLALPHEVDDDLVAVEDRPALAQGEVLLLVGQVTDLAGAPIPEARVEIWQADAAGRWPAAMEADVDPGFQGFGRTETDGQGLYRFRTVRPGAGHGRAAHIGFAVSGPGFTKLVTSVYFAGDPGLVDDPELSALPEPARTRLIAPLRPVPDTSPDAGAAVARFDVTASLNRTLKG